MNHAAQLHDLQANFRIAGNELFKNQRNQNRTHLQRQRQPDMVFRVHQLADIIA